MGRRVRLHVVNAARGIEHRGDDECQAARESAPAYRAAAVLTKELHASDFRSPDHLEEIILQQTCISRCCPLHGSVLSKSVSREKPVTGPCRRTWIHL
jgi:histidine ammonia-lyase